MLASFYSMQQAAVKVARFTDQVTFEKYQADDMIRSAVERQFEILGEALNQLLKFRPDLAATISEPSRIVGFRNVLIHGYHAIDDSVVWDVIQNKLPILHREINAALGVSTAWPPPP